MSPVGHVISRVAECIEHDDDCESEHEHEHEFALKLAPRNRFPLILGAALAG